MNHYQILAIISMSTLALVLGLTIYILIGKHSIKKVYGLAGFTLFLVLILMVLCTVIYRAYQIG